MTVKFSGTLSYTGRFKISKSNQTKTTTNILFAGDNSGNLYKIDPSDMSLKTSNSTGYSGTVNGVVFADDGKLYVAVNSKILKIDTSDMSISSSYSASNTTRQLKLGGDGLLYFRDGNFEVEKLNKSNMTRENRRGFTESVSSLDWGGDGFLYVSTNDGVLRKIDPNGMSKSDTLSTGESSANSALVSGDNDKIYAVFNDVIYKVDISTSSMSVDTSNSVPNNVQDIKFGSDGNVYVGTKGNAVAKYDPSNLSLISSYSNFDSWVYTVTQGGDGFIYGGAYSGSGGNLRKIDPNGMTLASNAQFFSSKDNYIRSSAWNKTRYNVLGWTLDSNGVVTDYGN